MKKLLILFLTLGMFASCTTLKNSQLVNENTVKSAGILYQVNVTTPVTAGGTSTVYGIYFHDADEFVNNIVDSNTLIGLKSTSIPGYYVLSRSAEETELTVRINELIVHRRQSIFPFSNKKLEETN